jgi:hypothetical protein
MASYEYSHKYTYYDENDNEKTVEVEFNYDPGRPANLTGHPDNWTPADGIELELGPIHRDGQELTTAETIEFLSEHEADIEDDIIEKLRG